MKEEILLKFVSHLDPSSVAGQQKRVARAKKGKRTTQALDPAKYAELRALIVSTEAQAQKIRALWAVMKNLRLRCRSLVKPAREAAQLLGVFPRRD